MARGQRDLAVGGDVGPLGQAVERLLDDLHRLVELGVADTEAVVVVADCANRDLELKVVIARVRGGLAQVPRVAGRPQQRPGDAELEHRLLVDDAGAAQALDQDLVLLEQVGVLVGAPGHVGDELPQLRLEAHRDVLHHAADLDVARVHPLAGGHLEQVEDLLALAEAVPEHRHRAEVERARPEPHEVGHDPVELEVDDPQVLRPRRDLEAEQRLDRAAEGHRVEVVGEVVHPLDHRDHLPVRLLLGGLLDPRVDVADDRADVADDLALERRQQAQDAVRGGVMRADVEGHQLVRLAWLCGDRDRLFAPAVVLGHAHLKTTSRSSAARCT